MKPTTPYKPQTRHLLWCGNCGEKDWLRQRVSGLVVCESCGALQARCIGSVTGEPPMGER